MNDKETVKNIILRGLDIISRQEIEKSIALYKLTRNLYQRNTNIATNTEFKWAYSAYYGLFNHYPKADLNNYFRVMQMHLDNPDKELSLNTIEKELKSSKRQYVYASKLLNFVDDDKYPIIDSRVFSIFKFDRSSSISCQYSFITQTYRDLLDNEQIIAFLAKFDFHGIGKMKMMDIIVWNLANKQKHEI